MIMLSSYAKTQEGNKVLEGGQIFNLRAEKDFNESLKESKFPYYQLVWMFCSRRANKQDKS